MNYNLELLKEVPTMKRQQLSRELRRLKTIPSSSRPLTCSEERLWRAIETRLGLPSSLPGTRPQSVRGVSITNRAYNGQLTRLGFG